jgi:hypothetical protein
LSSKSQCFRHARRGIALFSLAIAIVYLVLPTRNYYWDGIGFALSIEHPTWFPTLLHRHHLVYTPLGSYLYEAARWIGITVRAIRVLQVMSAVSGAFAVWLFAQAMFRITSSLYFALSLAALFAFSATWWRFATDASAYVPSVCLVLATFLLVLPANPPRPLLAAIAHSAAMLMHQLAALFFPVACLGILYQSRDLPVAQRASRLAQYAVPCAAITIAAYYAGFRQIIGGAAPGAFAGWVSGHSPDVSFSFDVAANLWKSLVGTVRLFGGGKLGLAGFVPLPLRVVLLLALMMVPAVAVRRLRASGAVVRIEAPPRPVLIMCLAWAGIYFTFLLFYLPHNTFYRLYYLPPLIILIGYGMLRATARSASMLPAFAGLLALWNLTFFILPHSRVEANPPLEMALGMAPVWNDKTLVYQGSFNPDNWLFFYINSGVRWKDLDGTDPATLEKEIRQLGGAGGNAWLDSSGIDKLFADPGSRGWLQAHTAGATRRELVNAKYRIRFVRVLP